MECAPNRYTRRLLVWALLCALLAVAVGIARREGWIPSSLRWVAALLPVVPMAG